MPDTPPQDSPRDSTIRDQPQSLGTLDFPAPASGKAVFTALPVEQHVFAQRYTQRGVIGQGGMGEVRLCHDSRIGRDVALKIRKPGFGTSGEARARFVREAKLQGQLEHPAIVPVYDLGAANDGEWFTMKRIRGQTLEKVIHSLSNEAGQNETRFGARKLLALFVQVCNAVAYAHARGVVHRDLKPSNVMVGDYGEVYVLDWGVAKVLGSSEVAVEEEDVPTRGGDRTMAGVVMGTPGYMSPEQAVGEINKLDARTDVYALGAILYELLTHESLHPLMDPEMAIKSTVRGVDTRPSSRRETPPELDLICVRALAMDPAKRYADARELAAAVERYLDGDRDLALRRQLADEQIDEAKKILSTSHGDPDAHTDALRALHRAYALDPTNDIAVRAMARLLLKPPARLPREAEEELARDDERDRRTTARDGAVAFLAWFGLSPFLLWAGVRSVGLWISIVITVGTCAVVAAWVAYRRKRPDDTSAWILLGVSTAAIALATTYLGPFVLAPGWACQNTLVFAMYGRGARRWAIVGIGTLGIIVPVLLELMGLVPPSFIFEQGRLVILPRMIDIPPAPTLLLLMIGNIAMVLVPSLIVGRLRDQALDTKRALVAHLARLRQLVPDEARNPDATT
jgi:eukaryotic-like serine/threonine-protein kinase